MLYEGLVTGYKSEGGMGSSFREISASVLGSTRNQAAA